MKYQVIIIGGSSLALLYLLVEFIFRSEAFFLSRAALSCDI